MTAFIQDFNAFCARMKDLFALDQRAYEPGALGTKTEESSRSGWWSAAAS